MTKYIIYFELFGRKMKTEVFAKDKKDAKMQIVDKLIFHKVEAVDETMFKDLKDIFPFL